MHCDATSKLTPWKSPERIDIWRNAVGMKRSPSPPSLAWLVGQPTPCSAYQFATSHGDNGCRRRPPESLPRCISNKCISDECDAWPEMHSLRWVLWAASRRECSSRDACSMSGLRTRTRSRKRVIPLQSMRLRNHVHFFPLFFSAIPVRTQLERRADRRKPFGTSYARSIGDRTHPLSPRYFFFFFLIILFVLCRAAPIPAVFTLLCFFRFLPLLSLICLVFERTCETKGFSLRYIEPLELLNPPLAAFSFSRVGIQENKCRPLPLELSLVTHLCSSYGTLIPLKCSVQRYF